MIFFSTEPAASVGGKASEKKLSEFNIRTSVTTYLASQVSAKPTRVRMYYYRDVIIILDLYSVRAMYIFWRVSENAVSNFKHPCSPS